MVKIALVEDNPDLRDEVEFHLSRLGHAVVGLPDGAALDAHLAHDEPEVLILDIGLPGEDGLSIAGRIRQSHPQMGIAMLTARGQIEDRLQGLKTGADIYLVKPVDMRELAAIVDSLHRRIHRPAPPARPTLSWALDRQTLELSSPTRRSVMVTPTEFKLLEALSHGTAEPVKRSALAAAIGHPEPDYDYRRLETSMSRLRKKIETYCEDDTVLRSARNIGYLFAAPLEVI